MKQIYLDMKKCPGEIRCAFVGKSREDLILNLAMPEAFLVKNAEYYLVTEDKKKGETVFLNLLARCENTLMFSYPSHLLLPPTAKFFVAAYARKEERVFLANESGPVYLFSEEEKGEEE